MTWRIWTWLLRQGHDKIIAMKSLVKLIIIALFFSIFVFTSHAQVPNSIDGVLMNVFPLNPAVGQSVTVSVESYVTDLNAAAIVWLVDGKNYSQGTGLKSINIIAPALGKTSVVVVAIRTVEGREVKKTVTIKSGDVDLVWESQGYVPPFYRGKSLFGYQNTIKINAIPHLAGSNGVELDPRTLVYKWKKGDQVIQDQSGYGKQTLTLKEDLPRPIDIEVEVGTQNGSQKGTAQISLQPVEPSISFYEEDSLYGVLYNKSLSNNVRLNNQEISIVAIPYNFTSYERNSPLTYAWSVNNLEQPDLSTNQSIVLRTKGDTEGSSDVSLEMRNTDDILQGARNAITVFFTKKADNSNVTF